MPTLMPRPTLARFILVVAVAAGATLFADNAQAYETYGQYCREYIRTVTIGGRTQQAYGTACLQPDGAWKTVNEGALSDADVSQNVAIVSHVEAPVAVYETYPVVYRAAAPVPFPFYLNLAFNTGPDHDRRWDRQREWQGHRNGGRHDHDHGAWHDRGGHGRH